MKTYTLEDFNLTPEELAELVGGAQTFLPPAEEEADTETNIPKS